MLGPLVGQLDAQRQTIERQADRVAELERENGRQSAKLEAARARISTLEASGATSGPDLTPESFWTRWPRGWIAGAATVLAIVAALLLVVPRW